MPTEEELRDRITAHLKLHNSSDTVALIWAGYIAALAEWGLISPDMYYRLTDLLPKVGKVELIELFTGTYTQEELFTGTATQEE